MISQHRTSLLRDKIEVEEKTIIYKTFKPPAKSPKDINLLAVGIVNNFMKVNEKYLLKSWEDIAMGLRGEDRNSY